MALKVAFGSVPKDSGTFTFYRNIRPALEPYGIELYCVSVGEAESRLWDSSYADDGCVLLAEHTRDIKRQAQEFVRWCEQETIDLVMGVNSRAILSSIPHLPERIRVLSRCANGFDHGYRITMSGRERLAAIVALTPRLAEALVTDYGADPALIHLIPNGIAPQPFEQAAATVRGSEGKLRLAFLGRLEHRQKGVLHLPRIVEALQVHSIPFSLHIAGKGRHEAKLRIELAEALSEGSVTFDGALGPKEIPNFLAKSDILLFTSHFEGCPNVLLEALMAGCVPVSWLIEGTTDYLIEDGETGFLVTSEDYIGMAERIKSLAAERSMLQRMGELAAQLARVRFTDDRAAADYAALFTSVMNQQAPIWVPRSWDSFRIDENFQLVWWKEIARRLGILHWMQRVKRYVL